MAEIKCIYDPLVELMKYYTGKKGMHETVDTSSLTVEERLKQRIIDGDQIGIDADLNDALKRHDPLTIINTFLLDGMKIVGELFGSGQMQLPFVLQSAETMKKAVAFLEPYMEKAEDSSKGVIVLATVKGDVHDIGKNLVDIILTNNGYRVHNLGIKMPIDAMLDAAEKFKAHAIGMSGLLVKSTLVMKENLQLMQGRGIDIPVLLGGAALTRRYVEHDLRAIYGQNVVYATDAFDGLHYMERLHNGLPIAVAEIPPGDEAAVSGTAQSRRQTFSDRGAVHIRTLAEEEIADVAELLNLSVAEIAASPADSVFVAVLDQRIVGGGRLKRAGEDVFELADVTVLPEQAKAGVALDLVRAMRRAARLSLPAAEILVVCDAADAGRIRLFRALGFDAAGSDDPRVARLNGALDRSGSYGAEPVLLFSKPDAALADSPAPAADDGASDVARDVSVPMAPFYGTRVIQNVRLEKVYEYINEVALIRGQWQVKKGSRTAEEYRRELEEIVQPKFDEMKLRAKREGLLRPGVIYGFYPCRSDGDALIVYKPRGLDGEELMGEWREAVIAADELEEWQRFEFPRQSSGRRLCIADFFRSEDSGEFDVLALQIVTMGSRATEYAQELFAANNYADYLYFHGLSVECAEALAEYWHKAIRTELGIAEDDAPDIRRLFSQGYRGSRYSFGYPACPNLEEQAKMFRMMRPGRIGVALSDEFMLEPEQSTSALIAHHPSAKYFLI